ncbi:SDR family oxidoreductase [Streptomyces sp. NPDC055140]
MRPGRSRLPSQPYAASKAALNHVPRLLAATLGPEVRVNAVAPGLVDSPMTKDWAQAHELWRERAPMRRPAQPADVPLHFRRDGLQPQGYGQLLAAHALPARFRLQHRQDPLVILREGLRRHARLPLGHGRTRYRDSCGLCDHGRRPASTSATVTRASTRR